MANHELDHTYFVDPGIGEKTQNCPYSNYADGRDVEMFIIPPKGYILTGFKLEPYDTPDHFYDGKIVAQYEKTSFLYGLKQNLLKYIAALVIIVLVSLIAVSIVRQNMTQPEQLAQSSRPEPETIATPIVVDTIEESDTIALLPDTVLYESEDTVGGMTTEEIAQEEPTENIEEEPVKPDIIQEDTIKEESAKEKPIETVVETPEVQLTPAEIKTEFKKEFWALIHHQEKRMSQYGKLYREYKGKVKGSEYNYLWLTILQSTSGFKVWNQKLNRIPADEIKDVNTISQLTRLIEEYE